MIRSLYCTPEVFIDSLRYSFHFKNRVTPHNWIKNGFIYLINVTQLGLYCIQQPQGNISGAIYYVLLSSVWLITGTTVAKLMYESVFANKRNNGWIALSNIRYILNRNLLLKVVICCETYKSTLNNQFMYLSFLVFKNISFL